MIAGVSKDVRHEIRTTFNQNFAHILRRFNFSSNIKLGNGNSMEDKIRFRRKKRLFCNICEFSNFVFLPFLFKYLNPPHTAIARPPVL